MEFNYEKSIKELEAIVSKLEKGDTSLDEMLTLYEKGCKLAGDCNKFLDEAQTKIDGLRDA